LLADNSYFFGYDRVSSLDIVVASHLAFHYHMPIPNSSLKSMLQSYPNLIRHFQNILVTYVEYDHSLLYSAAWEKAQPTSSRAAGLPAIKGPPKIPPVDDHPTKISSLPSFRDRITSYYRPGVLLASLAFVTMSVISVVKHS